jgi:hypothetical protein
MIVHAANVVMTAHVAHWIDEQPFRMSWIIDCLARHDQGDWGDLDPDDQAANNHAYVSVTAGSCPATQSPQS